MELIETITVGTGGAASITFSAIPQDGTDLLLKLSGQNDGLNSSVKLTLNNLTTNFATRSLRTQSGDVLLATIARDVADVPLPSRVAFSNSDIYFFEYASNKSKTILHDSVAESTDSNSILRFGSTIWSNSSAITSIKIDFDGDNFSANTFASLYKITKA